MLKKTIQVVNLLQTQTSSGSHNWFSDVCHTFNEWPVCSRTTPNFHNIETHLVYDLDRLLIEWGTHREQPLCSYFIQQFFEIGPPLTVSFEIGKCACYRSAALCAEWIKLSNCRNWNFIAPVT